MNSTAVAVAPIALGGLTVAQVPLDMLIGGLLAETNQYTLTRDLVAVTSMVLLPRLVTLLGTMVQVIMPIQPISSLSVPV